MKRVPRSWSFEQRFEHYVRRSDGCWSWTGPTGDDGYPRLRIAGRPVRVSRALLGLTTREELACHRCDNPGCVNPAHLFIGTDKTNAEDRSAKRRNRNSRKRFCVRGHDLAAARVRRGRRYCRECDSVRHRAGES